MLPNTTSDHLKHKPAIAFGSQIRKGSEKDLPKKNLRNAEKNVYINQLFWEQSPFPIPSLIFIPLTLLRARSRQVGKQRSISSGSITQMFHYKHHFTPVNNATCSEIHICWRVQDQSLVCAHANVLPRSSGGFHCRHWPSSSHPTGKWGFLILNSSLLIYIPHLSSLNHLQATEGKPPSLKRLTVCFQHQNLFLWPQQRALKALLFVSCGYRI